jgi:transporter family-2 protein
LVSGVGLAILAGLLVSLQNIFNNKVDERAGSWATTTLVLGLGFLASVVLGLIFEGKQLFVLGNMEPWYWVSGLIGVGVVTCLVHGMKRLGPTYAISIVLTAQLGSALLWDSMGWLGLVQVPFTYKQFIGVLVIITGILVFKLGNGETKQKVSNATQEG